MTDIDPSYWEPPDDPAAEDRFFEAFADVAREAAQCATCDDTGVQKDDRNCDCLVPAFEGAGQHSPGCACCKPCPCGAERSS